MHLKINAEGQRDVRVFFSKMFRKINKCESHKLFCLKVKPQNQIISVFNVVSIFGLASRNIKHISFLIIDNFKPIFITIHLIPIFFFVLCSFSLHNFPTLFKQNFGESIITQKMDGHRDPPNATRAFGVDLAPTLRLEKKSKYRVHPTIYLNVEVQPYAYRHLFELQEGWYLIYWQSSRRLPSRTHLRNGEGVSDQLRHLV